MVVMNLGEYKYLRQFNIMKLPEYNDIDITSNCVWALNPARIYINGKTLKRNLRLLYIAHMLLDNSRNDKLMNELTELLNANS